MYCRKCGSELQDDDEFCSNCGAKVLRDAVPPRREEPPKQVVAQVERQETTTQPPEPNGSSQRKRFTFRQSLLRFAICMVALAVCDSIFYALMPGKASVIEFITDSRGLAGIMGETCGASLLPLLSSLPLLYALPRCGYTKRAYAMEVFFVLNILIALFGQALRPFWPPFMLIVLIVGVAMRFLAPKKA